MPRFHGDAGCHRRGWDVGHGHGRSIRIGCGVRGGCGPLMGGARACGKTIFGFSFVLEVSSPTSFSAASMLAEKVRGLFLPVTHQRLAIPFAFSCAPSFVATVGATLEAPAPVAASVCASVIARA